MRFTPDPARLTYPIQVGAAEIIILPGASGSSRNSGNGIPDAALEVKSPYGSTYEAGWGDARRGMALFKRFDDGWRIGRVSLL